jgi:hypothetical protein
MPLSRKISTSAGFVMSTGDRDDLGLGQHHVLDAHPAQVAEPQHLPRRR